MEYRCARCHEKFAVADGEEAHACPRCKAEAGLEPVKKVPKPMMLFGVFLGCALVATVVGGVLSVVRGG
ncbi:MAG: hypothetical protein H6710_08165 [Myxococcales bacterium]|nr:hypothetical protein [Myxococcales bacterium]MCB9704224.1 hypothetical protein [Myxococcales bacterium]